MGIFDVTVLLLTVLQSLWTPTVQGYAVSPPPPMITAAPEYKFHIEPRQDSSVTCTEWVFSDGSQPLCPAGSYCFFTSVGDNGYEGCAAAANELSVFTGCYNYADWTATGNPSIVYCPATAAFCGEFLFSVSGVQFTTFGCDTTSDFVAIATYDGPPLSTPAASSFLPSSTIDVTSVPSMTPVTTPSVETPPASTTTLFISPAPSASSTLVPASGGTTSSSSSSNAATIGGAVGGAVGGLALLVGGFLLWYFLRKKRNQKRAPPQYDGSVAFEAPKQYPAPQEKGYGKSTKTEIKSPPLGKSHC